MASLVGLDVQGGAGLSNQAFPQVTNLTCDWTALQQTAHNKSISLPPWITFGFVFFRTSVLELQGFRVSDQSCKTTLTEIDFQITFNNVSNLKN